MKNLFRISIAVSSTVLLLSGAVIAAGGASQVLPANTVVMIASDGSEPLEFDENGDVTNLDYPNVVSERPLNIVLNPGEAEEALQSVLRVLPRLDNGTHVGFLHHIPVNPRLSTHVAAGAFLRRGAPETSASVAADESQKGVDPMLQLGVTYKLTPGLSVTAEFQRFFISEDDDLERYAVGMVYTF
jgi:hypothetical protein